MQAAVLETRGPAGVFLRDVPMPQRPEGGAIVRLLAASINRVDVYMRDSGAGITHTLPQILGVDGVGEIAEAAPGSAWRKGDRVILYAYEFCGRCRYCLKGEQPLCTTARLFGEHRDGTFADYIAVPESALVPLAKSADPLQAAALGVSYLTAWRMVYGKTTLGPGQIVLVQGAGGGVSYAAMQLARLVGARVIVTTSGEDRLAHFRALGLEAIDYRTQDVAKSVLATTDGDGADLVIDNNGEKSWASSLRALARGGHIVTCGATTGGNPSAELQRLFIRQLSVHGSTMGNLEEFRRLVRAFEAGRIVPQIDRVFPLARIHDALARLVAPERLGKIIVDIAGIA